MVLITNCDVMITVNLALVKIVHMLYKTYDIRMSCTISYVSFNKIKWLSLKEEHFLISIFKN